MGETTAGGQLNTAKSSMDGRVKSVRRTDKPTKEVSPIEGSKRTLEGGEVDLIHCAGVICREEEQKQTHGGLDHHVHKLVSSAHLQALISLKLSRNKTQSYLKDPSIRNGLKGSE